MKAYVYTRYGGPEELALREVAKPVAGPGQVLVKVHAVGLNAADWRMLRADPFLVRFYSGLFRPTRHTILGTDVAGSVEAAGPGVSRVAPGDEVYGDLLGSGLGGLAEYAVAPERAVVPKPARLTLEEAAAVPLAGLTALVGLRDRAGLRPGQRVLVHGASGGVGTYAVQIAKALGAVVTAVCSAGKVELARSLGADEVIDYTREDFAAGGRRWDVIFAANGARSILDYRRALAPRGVYLMVGGAPRQLRQALLWGPLLSSRRGRRLGPLTFESRPEDLEALRELIDSGRVRPVIDRRYPFAETPEAFRYLEAGHAAGKVIVRVA